jgi:hypothetical protein
MSTMRWALVAMVFAGCASTSKPVGPMMFEDFKMATTVDLAKHGWIMRTAQGWPGIAGALWGPESFTLNDGVLRMTSSTNGTVTRQSQLCHQRKYLDGTYGARVRLSDAPSAGPTGDQIVQSFYLISPSKGPMDPTYDEVDFEYLANGGWGTFKPTMFTTTWDTFQLEPWIADNTSTRKTAPFGGWHTFVAQVDHGTVRYFMDGKLFAGHQTKVYTEMMSINFNLWFVRDQLLKGVTDQRAYDEDIDWVYFRLGQVSPANVEAEVATLRSQSVYFTDTVPASGLDSPCNF